MLRLLNVGPEFLEVGRFEAGGGLGIVMTYTKIVKVSDRENN
ncbi:MAG: hypothetical protein U7126_14025 [Microcoleus sp.]